MSGEEVTFDSEGCVIAGTFSEAAAPVAAALLITGSGRVDRDSDARLPGGLTLRTGITRAMAEALAATAGIGEAHLAADAHRPDPGPAQEPGPDHGFLGRCHPAPGAAGQRALVPGQVQPQDVDAIGALVKGPFEGHIVGDLSHLLRPDPDSAGPRGYRRAMRQPVSPEILALITGWATSHWGHGATAHSMSAIDESSDS